MPLTVPDKNWWSIQMAQFSTVKPGTAARSVSAVTTEQLPNENVMAAIMMSTCCMGRPMRSALGRQAAVLERRFIVEWPDLPGRQGFVVFAI